MGKPLAFYEALYRDMEAARDATGIQEKVLIQVGSATCEKAAGADAVMVEFTKLIQASGRQDILLKQTGCTGRCAREPVVGVFFPGKMPVKYEEVTVPKVQTIFQEHVQNGRVVTDLMLDKRTDTLYNHVVTLCSSRSCSPDSGRTLENRLKRRLDANGVDPDTIRIFQGGCMGLCSPGAKGNQRVMMVYPAKALYHFRTDQQLDEIIQSHFVRNEILSQYLTRTDFITENFFKLYGDVAFFNKQTRLTLRNSGLIDPESLGDYVVNKGYEALARILDGKDSRAVIDEITRSGLRGRGGGGFPTGAKWKNAITYTDDPVKYVVCNADEGDPGAFMDRSALEGDPFIVIEGMTLGAYAIGARKGFVYIRAEYPLAIERLERAIRKAEDHRLLGRNIMDSGFDFEIEIRLGAGAFVCGEETALMYSIEGKRGQPRIRPPYPTQSGLWGHPTVINNVETWANVPTIILFGAEWFGRLGTEKSKGTKVFALAGKVRNTGLVEVPMGTPLREIIYDIGGGIPDDKALKAVQTGGPSGGCIPARLIDTPADFESLAAIGSIMGSGGMIILDEDDCMVATAKFFLEFTQSESCGKCVPCREGTLRMLEILERITSGEGAMEDLDKLERLGQLIRKTSLCGLGQTAPNPVLSTLQNFREEYEAHILQKRCPTHKCSRLLKYEIDPEKCVGCTLCARRCPVLCIAGKPKEAHEIDQSRCIQCGECFNACKFGAVKKN
ncbi:MAG TPA: NADH-quinone oxidoreductase subunit NuoF [bacterium]|nr:NADH-quinone oxidoreductase subunit NuoF [bacterium]